MKKWKRILCLLLALCLTAGGLSFEAAAESLPYTDVRPGDWFYPGVSFVHERGLMAGTGNGRFSPGTPTTRGMIVTILYQKEGAPAPRDPAAFPDVAPKSWYRNAVAWAAENDIVSGYSSGKFGPNDPITREQLAAILYQYSQYKGYGAAASADLAAFSDSGSVSPYARQPMGWAVGTGLLGGSGGKLSPKGRATRAQIATVLRAFVLAEENGWDAPDPTPRPEEPTPSPGPDEPTPAPSSTPDSSPSVYQTTLEETKEIEDGYREDSGYIPEEDWPALLAELNGWGEAAQADGAVTEYYSSEEDYTFSYRTSDGAYVIFVPDLEKLEECAASVRTYEPYRNSSRLKDRNFRKAQEKHGSLDDAAAFGGAGYTFDTDLDDGEVTLRSLAEWKPNSLVFLLTHGAWDENVGSALMTSQVYDPGNLPQSAAMGSGSIISDKNGYIGITDKFIRSHYGKDSLKGCLFWLGACSSAKSKNLQQALYDCGAETIIGTSKPININYLVKITVTFARRLNQKDSSGQYYTARAALDYAVDQSSGLMDAAIGAKMLLAGREDFRVTDNPAASLEVLVENSEGGVVGGATVSVDGKEAGKTGSGSLWVEDLYLGRKVKVTVSAPFYLSESQTVDMDQAVKSCKFVLRSSLGKIDFTLNPDKGDVSKGEVTVYCADSGPEGDVTQLVEDGSLDVSKLKMEDSGEFSGSSFRIQELEPNRWYIVKIAPESYWPAYYRVKAEFLPEARTVQVASKSTVTAGRKLRVQAVSSLSGEPLDKVKLTVSGRLSEDGDYLRISQAATGPDGWAEFSSIGDKYSRFKIEADYSSAADPYLPASLEFTPEDEKDFTQTIELAVGKEGCATINIRVTDEGDRPLSGARAVIYDNSEEGYVGEAIASTITGGKGYGSLPVEYFRQKLRIEVEAEGYAKGEHSFTKLAILPGTVIQIKLAKPAPTPAPTPTPAPVPPGTEDYIRVYTYEDWKAAGWNANVVLMNDITCPNGLAPFTGWSGILEGNGHSISNLKPMDGVDSDGRGGWLPQNNGTIRNVDFRNAQLNESGFAGLALINRNYGTIEGCTLDGSVSVYAVRNDSGSYRMLWGGGFALSNGQEGIIKDCVNWASVQVTGRITYGYDTSIDAAGIVTMNYGKVEHCLNLGNITAYAQGNRPVHSVDVLGVSGNYVSNSIPGTATDCGNGGKVQSTVEMTTTEQMIYVDPISGNATSGYVTDAMGDKRYTEVSRSELIDMWNAS